MLLAARQVSGAEVTENPHQGTPLRTHHYTFGSYLAMITTITETHKRARLTGKDNSDMWSVSTEMTLKKLKAWKNYQRRNG